MNQKPQVTIKMMKDQNPLLAETADIIIELEPEAAPNTVKNFIYLVETGYYNGLSFHRIIPGFMIQGGCPHGTGTGGPEYGLPGEFASNGFTNPLKHTRGVISMARGMDPNSAGSQFFIMTGDAPHLDGDYAAFGRVISGMETVDKIVDAPRDYTDRPMRTILMDTVTVDTFGVEYEAPKVIDIL